MSLQDPTGPASAGVVTFDLRNRPLSDVMQELEKSYFSHTMTEAGGNKAAAARMAGMTDETFRRKLSRYTKNVSYRFE